jgi:hypothetical protein
MINLEGHLFLLSWMMRCCRRSRRGRPANAVFSEGRQLWAITAIQIGFFHRTPGSSCGLAAGFVLRATQRGTGPAQQKTSSVVAVAIRLKVVSSTILYDRVMRQGEKKGNHGV